MAERVPPELQAQVVKLQQLQNQLGNLIAEKNVVESELREINRILESLSTLPADSSIYKIVGNLLVKFDKASVEKELTERKEFLEIRSKAYQRQESELRKQYESVQKKVNELVSKYYKPPAGAEKV
ncbi:prefoldin subunit beta [Sulfodiicoccus acidiphilus]|nr:prefoldin subunit beta [Sulfodiicoccus acidiphilus]